MRVNIFLDDIRDPAQAYNYTKKRMYLDRTWIVVRDYKEFVAALEKIKLDGDEIAHVSFDHDLAIEHMEVPCEVFNDYTAEQLGMEMTGLDCAKYFTEFIDKHKMPFPGLSVHSQNPVGKERIEQHLMDWLDDNGGAE